MLPTTQPMVFSRGDIPQSDRRIASPSPPVPSSLEPNGEENLYFLKLDGSFRRFDEMALPFFAL